MSRIIAATQNKHKIREIEAITKKFGMEIVSRDEAGIEKVEVVEDGTTFEENSYLKARTVFDMIREDPAMSQYLDSPVIADDSGLEVDYLNKEPGIYSSRYLGEDTSYEINPLLLLLNPIDLFHL